MKKCCYCKQFKTREEFYTAKDRKDKLTTACKVCNLIKRRIYYKNNKESCNQKSNAWRANNRGYIKFHQLKTKYGLTREAYEKMMLQQDNKCKICKQEPKELCVDHCHTTGKVRGLLCAHCNSVIGFAKEDVERLKHAIVYLEESNASL